MCYVKLYLRGYICTKGIFVDWFGAIVPRYICSWPSSQDSALQSHRCALDHMMYHTREIQAQWTNCRNNKTHFLSFSFLSPFIVSKLWRERERKPTRCNNQMFIINTVSTCFGHHYVHLQENKDRVLLHVVCCDLIVASCWFSLSLSLSLHNKTHVSNNITPATAASMSIVQCILYT